MKPIALLGGSGTRRHRLAMWIRAMELRGIPYELIGAETFGALGTARYGAAVLDGWGLERTAVAALVDRFVQDGGHVVAVGDIPDGVRRWFPGLTLGRSGASDRRSLRIADDRGFMRWRAGEVLQFTAASPGSDDGVVIDDHADLHVLAREHRHGDGEPADGGGRPALVATTVGRARLMYTPLPLGAAEWIEQPAIPTFTEFPYVVGNDALLVFLGDILASLHEGSAFAAKALWPSGARCAVCITGDVHDYTGIGLPEREDREHRDMLDYMDVLREHGMEGRATFFASGAVAAAHPDTIRAAVARGYEVCPHTYKDTCYSSAGLTAADQRRDVERCIAAFRAAVPDHVDSGAGFRTHGYNSNHDTRTVLDRLGYRYLADLQAWDPDDVAPERDAPQMRYLPLPRPAEGRRGERLRLLEMPDTVANDHFVYRVYGMTPAGALDYYRRQFDRIHRLGGLFLVCWHPYVSLREAPGREDTFRAALDHIRAHSDVALLRVKELAAWWGRLAGVDDQGEC